MVEDFVAKSAELASLGGVPVDKYDLQRIRMWLKIMFKEGTNGIKITVGNEPNTWIVRLVCPECIVDDYPT